MLEDYHSGRELVIMLVDMVSRGGNLLLDIGPKADGTIPAIMEERLLQIGDWLKINGDAIYGTRPWKHASSGARAKPKINYNKEFETAYDVTKLIGSPSPAKPRSMPSSPRRATDVYAILPRWPGRQFTLKEYSGGKPKAVVLLGSGAPLRFNSTGSTVTVELPELSDDLLGRPAWVLKFTR